MDPVNDPVLDPDYPVTHTKQCLVYIKIVMYTRHSLV